jgi:GNAT superfamily N-acetyltransferase
MQIAEATMHDDPAQEFLRRWEQEVLPGLDARVTVDLAKLSEWRVEVHGIEVDAGSRRQGLGTAAMNALTNLADDLGVFLRLSLEPSRMGALAPYYERFGFVEAGDGEMEYEPVERESPPSEEFQK